MRITRGEMLMRLAIGAPVEGRIVEDPRVIEEWADFPNGSMWTDEQQMSAFYDDGAPVWQFRIPKQD